MKKLKYICRVVFGSSFKRLHEVISRTAEKSGKNRVFIFFDMLVCTLRYGAGYHDYLIFGFYNMNSRQRNTYMTRIRNKKLITLMNDPVYAPLFDQKNLFNERFKAYLGREFVDVAKVNEEQFAEFLKGKDIVFAKPNIGESGKGIERLKKADFTSPVEMLEYIKSKKLGVVEQLLTQHEDLNRLYPLAINALRIVTIVTDGVAHCAYAVSKSGNEGKFVDNMENSGLCCPIDQDTGRICGVAHTSALINYDKHPYTGVELIGFKVPYVKEAIELVKKAALEVPQVKFVGWDVCITPDGPVIIEGNDYPGYDFWQLPEHTPDKIGLYPYYKALVKEL